MLLIMVIIDNKEVLQIFHGDKDKLFASILMFIDI